MSLAPSHLTGPVRTVVPCREYGEIDVPPEQVLSNDGTLRVRDEVLDHFVTTDFKNGNLRLRAKGVSGLFQLTDEVTVQVRPRFPLTNLTHMVSMCGYVPTAINALRSYSEADRWDDWMLGVTTDALLAGVDAIEERGLWRTYYRRLDGSSNPHGRIEMSPTINRYASRGIKHKVVHSWFEKTTDNAPNRCLKAAALLLHDRYRVQDPTTEVRRRITRLGNALRLFEEVSEDRGYTFLGDTRVRGLATLPEARSYYRPTLDLAATVLNNRGLDLDADDGSVLAGSLMVKTDKLFEDYVRLSLQRNLAASSAITVLDGNFPPGERPLYERYSSESGDSLPSHVNVEESRTPSAAPDLLFESPDGSFPLVADVKYTKVSGYVERSELEQVMTYSARYASPLAMTIHPRQSGTTGGLVVSGRIGHTLVAQYRVDLSADDLEAEMEAMARSVVGLISAVS